MVEGWSIHLNVYFIHETFANGMLRSYLRLHVGCNYTYAINRKFSCNSHLQLFFSPKLKMQNEIFLILNTSFLMCIYIVDVLI